MSPKADPKHDIWTPFDDHCWGLGPAAEPIPTEDDLREAASWNTEYHDLDETNPEPEDTTDHSEALELEIAALRACEFPHDDFTPDAPTDDPSDSYWDYLADLALAQDRLDRGIIFL